MASREPGRGAPRRRGMVRVPFIRRCRLLFDDATTEAVFIVNINVIGAYIARDAMPRLGHRLSLTFRAPERETDVVVQGAVTWVNPRQQHPVHSLPPGFGVKFDLLGAAVRGVVEQIVEDYVARNPQIAR